MDDLKEAICRQMATMTSEETIQQFKRLFGREIGRS
jgi:hypothetical protein